MLRGEEFVSAQRAITTSRRVCLLMKIRLSQYGWWLRLDVGGGSLLMYWCSVRFIIDHIA